ncbi:MAG TPA: adenosylhomocysteinase [Propionicimonas sp.]
MEKIDAATWAELVVRRYARQTNRLIAGRVFAVRGSGPYADALRSTLICIGARVVGADSDEPVDTCFEAEPPDLFAALTASYLGEPRDGAAERIAWARQHMPVVEALGQRLAGSGLLAGRRVGICLVLEPKTAVLARVLAEAGAEVSLYAHPEETDAAVAAELRDGGIPVFGGLDDSEDGEQERFLAQRLHVLIDDGSRLIRRLIATPGAASELIGAAEETTSGLRPLRELAELPFPVIAVNDARTKSLFDNAHGTGQSCLLTILDLLDPEHVGWGLHRRTVAVAGFGPVGEGFARNVRALGGAVLVADPDPVAELRARFAGYRTGPLEELVAEADLIVSASGYPHTITAAALEAARPGAAVAVAGGVVDEVDWRLVLDAGGTFDPVREHVEDLRLASGNSVRLLDRGGCINCTAGEGNPIEIMDLSFAVQFAAVELLLTGHLSPGLHAVPAAADELIARLALDRSLES